MQTSNPAGFSPVETARYTQEMLETLSRIATQQGQHLLAHLLNLARVEAQIQGDQPAQETSLPG